MPRTPRRIVHLIVLTASLAVSSAHAQQPIQDLSQLHHTSWTQRDGAPAGIEVLAQTSDGFLWLATGAGLFRFDGVRFELYEPPAGQHLPSTNVSALLARPDGALWVGYRFGGVSLIQGDTIQSWVPSDSLPRGSVISMVEDSAGTTWVATTSGLARLVGGAWHRVGPAEGLPDGNVTDLMVDRKRQLWVSAEAGVFVWEEGASGLKRIAPSMHSSGGSRIYSFLVETPAGAIWASSQDRGLQQVAPAPKGSEPEVMPRVRESMSTLIDRSGALWLARPNIGGVERYWLDPSRTAAAAPVTQRMTVGLSSELVTNLLLDREGNVWASTAGGLDRFRPAKLNRFELPGLQENIALAAADSGGLWVGSLGRSFLRVGADVVEYPAITGPVEMVYRDPAGAVWAGSPYGLWRFERGRSTPVKLPDVRNVGIQAATIDGKGDLWISIARAGVFRRTGDTWIPFGELAGLPREPAIVLTTDDSARTWFGYTAGRVALLQRDAVRLFTDDDGLHVGNVLSIHVRGGNVWVGGEFGLATLVGNRFQPVTGRDGPEFRGISGIVETPEGEVWLHGANGIARIPAAEVQRARQDSIWHVEAERLDFRDGLDGAAQQIRPQPTVIAGTDGRLWFATTTNIAWLDPRSVPRNQVSPPVQIRRLIADDRTWPITPDLRLPIKTSALRIDYTALSLSIPERVRFRYQLIGSDTTWHAAGSRREAFYTNLKPGHYRFLVMAANDDGLWNPVPAELAFTIPPSFTQTPWFLALCIAGLAGLVWLAYRLRVGQVEGALQLRYKAALDERTRIAQELHDTLLQGFTGITLQLRAIERRLTQKPEESADALKKVLSSADTALRDARHIIWDMRAMELEGSDLADALEAAARQAMADSPAHLVFLVKGDRRRLPLDVETTALRVGREAVLNAMKHAAPGTVEVNLEYGARTLVMRVVDDGTGILPGALEAAASGEHLGMAGMNDRAQRTGGNLEVTSEPGRGTTVVLVLPIRDSNSTRA